MGWRGSGRGGAWAWTGAGRGTKKGHIGADGLRVRSRFTYHDTYHEMHIKIRPREMSAWFLWLSCKEESGSSHPPAEHLPRRVAFGSINDRYGRQIYSPSRNLKASSASLPAPSTTSALLSPAPIVDASTLSLPSVPRTSSPPSTHRCSTFQLPSWLSMLRT
jgi:hypothetical protein